MTRVRKMMLEELAPSQLLCRHDAALSAFRRAVRTTLPQVAGQARSGSFLRSYQAYLLTELKLCPGSVENHVAALRFFFVRTLHRHEFRVSICPIPRRRRSCPTSSAGKKSHG